MFEGVKYFDTSVPPLERMMQQIVFEIANALRMQNSGHVVVTRKRGSRGSHATINKNSQGKLSISNVTICMEDVELISMECGITMNEAVRKVVAHELMHFVVSLNEAPWPEVNQKLMNISQDLEINGIIGLDGKSFIHPDHLGLPVGLTWKQYYKLLENEGAGDGGSHNQSEGDSQGDSQDQSQGDSQDQSQDDSEDQGDGGSHDQSEGDSQDQGDGGSQGQSQDQSQDDSEDQSEGDADGELQREKLSSDLGEVREKVSVTQSCDYSAEDLLGIGQGGLPVNVKRLNKVLKFSGNNYSEITDFIVREESQKELVPTRRGSSWKKHNHRNSGKPGTMILPGRKIVSGGLRQKYFDSATVFVDVSYSTGMSLGGYTIWSKLMDIAQRLHMIGMTVVYYTTQVQLVVKPGEDFDAVLPCGGTSILSAVGQHFDSGVPRRVYIISDGADYYSELPEQYPNVEFNVWVVGSNSIKKLKL